MLQFRCKASTEMQILPTQFVWREPVRDATPIPVCGEPSITGDPPKPTPEPKGEK